MFSAKPKLGDKHCPSLQKPKEPCQVYALCLALAGACSSTKGRTWPSEMEAKHVHLEQPQHPGVLPAEGGEKAKECGTC